MQLPGPVKQKAIELVQEKKPHSLKFLDAYPLALDLEEHKSHHTLFTEVDRDKCMTTSWKVCWKKFVFPCLTYLHTDGRCAVKARRAKEKSCTTKQYHCKLELHNTSC